MATRIEVDVPPFYVNFFLLNAGGVVKAQIDTKLKCNPVARFLAGSIASLAVKDAAVTAKVATQLEAQLPQRMHEMGLGITCKKVFLHNSFVVFECQLEHITLPELILKAKGEAFAGHFQSLMDAIDAMELTEAKSNMHTKVTDKVCTALLEKLETKLPEKLGQQGLEVNVVTRTAADQAKFFFDCLNSLDEEIGK
ncbi:Aste57867_9879 [Aphanomyces stellatus]|uniref:Aste57867_9879 protein n=1 Tax=Aphanomyces stellatus TaxID=120398 RepID=A0A485KP89_9STRA|nr:hypothetical protein As57867_009840 [Aphanomyces stellatus]VFT86758.1 Aste57867_9879 [Aphanomyces stellatus]